MTLHLNSGIIIFLHTNAFFSLEEKRILLPSLANYITLDRLE